MSRIDEAMRRAAGAGAVEPPPEQTVEDLQPEETAVEATALAREGCKVVVNSREIAWPSSKNSAGVGLMYICSSVPVCVSSRRFQLMVTITLAAYSQTT